MYKQNTKFPQMKDKRLGMRNSSKVNKTGFNVSGGYRGGSNRGRINKSFDNRQFNLQDVTKLKQLCTATNEWIQQKSSELLDVLSRSESKSGDTCHRTVTLQSGMSKMNFGHKPPNIFDRRYKDDDFQQNSNSSGAPNFDYVHLNKSHPASMHYEQNRERCNQEERNWGFEPTDMTSYQSKPKSHLFSVMEKMKMYINKKPFTVYNAPKVFVEAVHATGTSYTLNYVPLDKNKQHRFNLIVENLVVGIGRSFSKKKARLEAYVNALNQIKSSSIAELCDDGSSGIPESMNKLSYQTIIKPDHTRPVSSLVIRETQKTAVRRDKHAMSILRRSVYFSKMNMNKLTSAVGNVHKVTILVQNKPVGIGFGNSVTKAGVNAAADALFNNFYRKNPVIQALDDDDESNTWIHWTNIKYLAKEMERIGGHSLIAGQNVSNRSYVTAIKKLVDTHPWNEANNELVFGPGMSDNCVASLYSIAKEKNLNFEERRHHTLGTYYIIQRYYDPVDIVRYLEKKGGCNGKYRLVPKAEISQIQCDHWEPTSQVWNQEKEVLRTKGKTRKRRRVPGFPRHGPRLGESDRNFDNSSSHVGRAVNTDTFSSMSNKKQKIAINDDQEFAQMSNYKKSYSKEKYFLPNNNDGRLDQRFTQDKEICGFNDGEFRQMSRSNNEFRPMSDSCDREPKQMSWPDDKGFRQMLQADNKGFRQMPQLDDKGFGQMPQPGDKGFRQMRQPEDTGFGQMRQPDDREFEQMRQPDDRGFGQMRQPDDKGFGQMRQSDDRGFGQMRQPDDRGFGQMRQPDDRGFGQVHQHDSEEFGQKRWLDNREFGQMRRPDEVEFGQMCRPDDRELGQMSRPNNEESNQSTWHDRREFKQTFWSHDKELNRMPGSHDREFRETSRLNAREFRRMHGLEEHKFKQIPGLMERGMSDNFDREFSHDKKQTLGHDERRFNTVYGYTAQISDSNEREFNSQFRYNERERGEQVLHSYDENYKQVSDVNKERFSQNPYEDKLSGQSDIGFHHSSNYDKRFNKNVDFDKQVSDPDNRHYNQLLLQNKRDHDQVSCDDNRLYAQVPNYDDRRLRFSNDQLTSMDHQNNQMKQDDLMDTNRMQSNAPWNKMQDPRGDGRITVANSRMYRPNTQVPCGPPQENMMMQNMMNINQAANKDQLVALRFLTKKIAHTALHANVKSILANARRLSNIAKARSRMEMSAGNKAPLTAPKHGKEIEANKFQKRTVPGNRPKTPPFSLQTSQNSKVTKRPSEKQSALNKSRSRRVSAQSRYDRKKRFSRSAPKGGNTIQKTN